MSGEGKKPSCECFICTITRALQDYVDRQFPKDEPDRPPGPAIAAALVEALIELAKDLAMGIEDPKLQRSCIDAGLAHLIKFRVSVTDVATLVNLDTGESTPVADLFATKH